jgi:hypothetical protein
MDFGDILLPLAKMLRYLGLTTLTDATFVAFLLSWLVTRQIGLLLVTISVAKDTSRSIEVDHPEIYSKQLGPYDIVRVCLLTFPVFLCSSCRELMLTPFRTLSLFTALQPIRRQLLRRLAWDALGPDVHLVRRHLPNRLQGRHGRLGGRREE